jgi:tRNA A-37 threonylcarbamoyl transferase component Bud32
LFASLLSVFPQLLSTISQNAELLSRFQRVEDPRVVSQLLPSEQYLFVPTHNGLVPLSDSTGIEDFARKMFRTGVKADVKVEELGGILNDVFLVRVSTDGEEKRVVAKRFRDWSSFKWFPLTLWSVGTRSFVVLGRSRLEREYALNQLLRSRGFAVPKVLYVSGSERLIFMEYVEGEDFSETIRRAAVAKTENVLKSNLEIVARAGELLAKVHAAGVTLGDAKPENLLLSAEGEIFMLDLEQASRKGDKAWDVAEFLYYAGHYIPLFVEVRRAESIAKAFIRGYARGGGDVKIVKRAGNPKYTKVFSVFTFPHIMLVFSALCRKADKPKDD